MRTHSTSTVNASWLAALLLAALPVLWTSCAQADSCRKRVPHRHLTRPALTKRAGEGRNSSLSPDGRIRVFQSNRAGNWEIYRINRNGTGLRRLTHDAGPYAPSDTEPVFSPDGRTIAWTSTRVNGDYSDIWLMDATGTNQRRLTSSDTEHSKSRPIFSPQGGEITYWDCTTQTPQPTWMQLRHNLRTGVVTTMQTTQVPPSQKSAMASSPSDT